jgi:hypothetical protein
MEKHRFHIFTLAFMLFATVVALSAFKETRLDLYLSLFAMEYFVASAVFRPRRRFIDIVGVALFLVFCVIVAEKVAIILLLK